jgi:hypothetical protein
MCYCIIVIKIGITAINLQQENYLVFSITEAAKGRIFNFTIYCSQMSVETFRRLSAIDAYSLYGLWLAPFSKYTDLKKLRLLSRMFVTFYQLLICS